ncbi:hypothetical protein NCG89_09875 [Spongiibacter taiwanensis]|uniref:hypothetical protein n=1 Tax=Spongiibacter taiwanensis TaxID=1748242 RepID=UPI002035A682|nr:hypothetical protein [Spongiibacter taiwanensis]USA41825.1 hypothetical protein NCG89_09875 [Spongiibacter taiwanensis]
MSKDIEIELEKLRGLRKLCHGPLAAMLVAFLLGFVLPESMEPFIKVVAFASVAAFFATFFYSFKINNFVCPRCGQRFHAKRSDGGWYSYNLFARKCKNCGLMLNGGNAHEHL